MMQLVSERTRSEKLVSGQKEVLEMIAHNVYFERTIEALAFLVEKVEPDLRCAISTLNSDGAAFANVYAPNLPRPCKVRLLQMAGCHPWLNPNGLNVDTQSANLGVDLARDGQLARGAWAQALRAEGYRGCLFVPIFDSRGRPLALLSVLGMSSSAKLPRGDFEN